jgi:hypothetical protein
MGLHVGQRVKLPSGETRCRKGETHGTVVALDQCGYTRCRNQQCVSVAIITKGEGSATVNYDRSELLR